MFRRPSDENIMSKRKTIELAIELLLCGDVVLCMYTFLII